MVRVTVANDSRELLELFGEVLASDRHLVATLLDSDDVDLIRQIQCADPELLVIDLQHGEEAGRGWRIVQEIKATPGFRRLPVVLCSADPVALADLQPQLCSMSDVVPFPLPFEVDALLGIVRRLTLREEAPQCS